MAEGINLPKRVYEAGELTALIALVKKELGS